MIMYATPGDVVYRIDSGPHEQRHYRIREGDELANIREFRQTNIEWRTMTA